MNPPRRFAAVLPPVVIRQQCEDFDVEELPAYLPDGSGEHLYLWIEKRDLPAAEFLSRLARILRVSSRDIGVAGQKDRRAVTRQFVSVPRQCESRLSEVEDPRFRILSISAHGNKLRTGHLTGNRFRLILRAEEDAVFTEEHVAAASERLQLLEHEGFPNYFGPQRFGHDGQTAIDGVAFLKGELTAKHWKHQQRRFMIKMVSSAAQSAVMNLVLAERVTAGTCATPGDGDVVCSRDGMRPFLFNERGETSADNLIPMGPMPGPKMMAATGAVLDSETEVLNKLGLTCGDFENQKKFTSGTRRRFVEYPSETNAELLPDGAIRIGFDLPAGSFATVLLSELAE